MSSLTYIHEWDEEFIVTSAETPFGCLIPAQAAASASWGVVGGCAPQTPLTWEGPPKGRVLEVKFRYIYPNSWVNVWWCLLRFFCFQPINISQLMTFPVQGCPAGSFSPVFVFEVSPAERSKISKLITESIGLWHAKNVNPYFKQRKREYLLSTQKKVEICLITSWPLEP